MDNNMSVMINMRMEKDNFKINGPSYQLISPHGSFQYLQIHAEETAEGSALKSLQQGA